MKSVSEKAPKKERPPLRVEGIYLRNMDVQVVRFEDGKPVYLPGYAEASRAICKAMLAPRVALPSEVSHAAD